ncbi:hypothetical protein MCOR25_007566 [Pyricularia grisea]|nr:hypothetical protein MCOR25_007566 [Pyricularia grisea]
MSSNTFPPFGQLPEMTSIAQLGSAILNIRDSLARQMDEAQAEFDRCQTILDSLVDFQIKAMEAENLKAKCEEADKELARLQEENAILTAQVNNLKTQRDRVRKELERSKANRSDK